MIDFWSIWNAYYANANINRVRGDSPGVWDLLCSRLGTGGACNIALSVAADIGRGNSPGIFMDYKKLNSPTYNTVALGAWTIGGGRVDPTNDYMTSSNILTGDTVADHDAVFKRICVYKFLNTSPLINYPTGWTRISTIEVKSTDAAGRTETF